MDGNIVPNQKILQLGAKSPGYLVQGVTGLNHVGGCSVTDKAIDGGMLVEDCKLQIQNLPGL